MTTTIHPSQPHAHLHTPSLTTSTTPIRSSLRTQQCLQSHLRQNPIRDILRLQTNLRRIDSLLKRQLRQKLHPRPGPHRKVRHLLPLRIGHRTPRDQKDVMHFKLAGHPIDVRRRRGKIRHRSVQFLLIVDGLPRLDEGRAFQRPVFGEEGFEGEIDGKVEYQSGGHVLDGHLDLGRGRLSFRQRRQHIRISDQFHGVFSGPSHGNGGLARDLLQGGAESKGVFVELNGQGGDGDGG
mmetsp:Transcript_26992/g.56795  ORF Transcript_26992/g.56795 Transcript_26992/m.56795 type:complete len:237 (+) Transcript_26992:186-896(+)